MTPKLTQYWHSIQSCLFPDFESQIGLTTNKHHEIMVVLDMLEFERYIYDPALPSHRGRPTSSRVAIAKAFTAKSVMNLPSTEALLDRLKSDIVLRRICGFNSIHEVPSRGTFSNAFKEYSENGLLEKIHQHKIKDHYDKKIIGHLSRDSTEIDAREKPLVKKKANKPKHKRGRPKKGEIRDTKPPTRLEKQLSMSFDEMLADLPDACDVGSKRNSKGHTTTWIGYKLHLDTADGGVPISAILTSASVHDSQVAIPLEAMSASRSQSLYSLMDAAYDVKEIKQFVSDQGKVSIIDPNKRRTEAIPLDPPQKERFKERTTVERSYSQIKDSFGGRQIMVKGPAKVMTHLMFGILAVTAEQLIRTFS